MALATPHPDVIAQARTVFLEQNFGLAFCEHFGLPPGKVLVVTPIAARDEILHAKVEIALSPDDLAGIAARLGAAAGGA